MFKQYAVTRKQRARSGATFLQPYTNSFNSVVDINRTSSQKANSVIYHFPRLTDLGISRDTG